jgi:hypothetical protein
MNDNYKSRSPKLVIVSVLLSIMLLATTSCFTSHEATSLESMLENLGDVDGQATFVTKDGETVTITVTKDTETDIESTGSNVNENQDKESSGDKECTDSENLADILPTLDCIEDIFKTLGVWEDTAKLQKQGLTWSHIAEELGYDADKMYREIEEIIEEHLHHAKELGLINQDQLEYKLNYFGEKALKWINKIFADTGKDTEDLADILPKLDCIEDVFKTLGVWEDAAELYRNSLAWSRVAGELGYDADKMYHELEEIIEERLQHARELELISQSQYEYKYNFFCEKALKWTDKIFADTVEDNSEDLADILPTLDGIEDAFKTLDLWEEAVNLYKKGLNWALAAEELGYDKNKMYRELKEIIEERLQHARELELIDQDQYEYKYDYFCEKALNWTNIIFEFTDIDSSEELASILPTLDRVEDVFKTLGVWEETAHLREQGLTWSHIAEELGYDKDKMYRETEEIIEESLQYARELELINQNQHEYKYNYFCEKALKWINKIFST